MKTLTTEQLRYLQIVAADLIDGNDATDCDDEKDAIWYAMSMTERDEVNAIVEGVFGEWL